MSGEVSDESAVSFGNEIGVDTIVTYAVTGTGNLRRLVVRAISVEKSTVVYQQSFEI
jgi:hypothetical protein